MSLSVLAAAPLSSVLQASDLGRARNFYEGVLGLELSDVPGLGFFVSAGNGTRALVYTTGAGPGAATVAAFLVDDLLAVVAELRGRGAVFEEYDMPPLVTVDGIADMGPMGKAAWFKDSEGNIINIVQM